MQPGKEFFIDEQDRTYFAWQGAARHLAACIYQESHSHIDKRVFYAIANTPRHLFLPSRYQPLAYTNEGFFLDIDQIPNHDHVLFREDKLDWNTLLALTPATGPGLLAQQIHHLIDGDIHTSHALEVGGGTGYGAALLSNTGFGKVTTVEMNPLLSSRAKTLLKDFSAITAICGDAKDVLAKGRYDSILVTAQVRDWTTLQPFIASLDTHGRLVVPLAPELVKQYLKPKFYEMFINQDEDPSTARRVSVVMRIQPDPTTPVMTLVTIARFSPFS